MGYERKGELRRDVSDTNEKGSYDHGPLAVVALLASAPSAPRRANSRSEGSYETRMIHSSV